jgi:peroxiredoxin
MLCAKYLRLVIPVLVCSALLYMPYKIVTTVKTKKRIDKQREILPDFEFLTVRGIRFGIHNIVKDSPLVIVFFNSECFHCINELECMINNAGSLKKANVLLVSEQPLSKLQELYEEYKFYRYPQFELLHTDYQYFISLFGNVSIPATFIYNGNNRLLKMFTGEVSIETLKEIINNSQTKTLGFKGN